MARMFDWLFGWGRTGADGASRSKPKPAKPKPAKPWPTISMAANANLQRARCMVPSGGLSTLPRTVSQLRRGFNPIVQNPANRRGHCARCATLRRRSDAVGAPDRKEMPQGCGKREQGAGLMRNAEARGHPR